MSWNDERIATLPAACAVTSPVELTVATPSSPLAQVTGDGIYDEWRCWDAVAARPERPRAVFPPPR